MNKDYELNVSLKEVNGNDVFSNSYRIALWKEFVENTNPKEHGFKSHVE